MADNRRGGIVYCHSCRNNLFYEIAEEGIMRTSENDLVHSVIKQRLNNAVYHFTYFTMVMDMPLYSINPAFRCYSLHLNRLAVTIVQPMIFFCSQRCGSRQDGYFPGTGLCCGRFNGRLYPDNGYRVTLA